MNSYTIKKVLNNNVLICEHDNAEVVVIGKGLGFKMKPGMTIDQPETIEKVFVLQNKSDQDHYKMLIEQTDEHILRVVIDSVQLILSYFDLSNKSSFIVSLTDHIIFALKRLKQNQLISNPFLSETKYSYPEAYQIAKRVVARINLELNVTFPEDEVGFIALHIASQIDDIQIQDTQKAAQLIQNIIKLIENDLSVTVSTQSIQYQRFVRHIHFLLHRLRKNEHSSIDLNFETLLKAQYPLCYNIAIKASRMIQSQIGFSLYGAEIAYLTLHMYQLSLSSKKDE
ncbi:glucose PTS transporter transcription antiterminator GlcT [Staphylococcus canis]|uniref:Transcription antiterminator n=1 Tax=Staphylococcus canis TaxID=2724942 RepID=A0ABS0TAI0_9STAP|nr:transcription antiterminator [Staphylococcus canis]MBI5975427.1 transcription antiterminator [Staphylococcus canis]